MKGWKKEIEENRRKLWKLYNDTDSDRVKSMTLEVVQGLTLALISLQSAIDLVS